MTMQLLEHQTRALYALERSMGSQLLALAPGAGKTLTALTALPDDATALIVCPAPLTGVWVAESRKWGKPVPIRMEGTPKERNDVYDVIDSLRTGFRIVVGYEMFLREYKNLCRYQWTHLVLDESHRVKNPTAKVSKALRRMAAYIPYRILLSGTPLINSWGDLWNQIEIVHPGSMGGNWYAFRNRFAIMPLPGVPAIKGWREVPTIKAMIAPWMFTVTKEELDASLPPLTVQDVPVTLSDEERKAYAELRDRLRLELSDGEELTIPNAMVKVGRLKQCANGLHNFGIDAPCGKLAALKEIIEGIGSEHCIVHTEYAQTAKYLKKELGCRMVCGEVSDKEGEVDTWKKEGGVLVGTSSIREGFNLQEARYMVQYDLSWSAANEDQRIARAHRTGQTRPVHVWNLMAEDTLEAGIRSLIERKRGMADEAAGITLDELKGLV